VTAVHIGMCAVIILTRVAAATFTVNSTADLPDASSGDGACATGNLTPHADPECTLRTAIQESNALSGFPPDQVKLLAGTYVLTAGSLEITSSLSIAGSGADSTIVDGNGSRNPSIHIFLISNPGTNPIVNISDITIRNGQGGIDSGTGIFISRGSSLSLVKSVVRDNRSAVGGVGIANSGSLTISRSTVRDNQVTGGGGGVTGTGGGILNSSGAHMEIIESTISNNQAIRGGGINNVGMLDITNSTISGNKASAGSAIRNGTPGVVNISFSTITKNEAGLASGEPLTTRFGGGILNFSQINMGNTILAENMDRRTPSDALFSPDCFSQVAFGFTSFRGNLVGVVNENCDFRDTIFGAPPPFDMVGTEDHQLVPGLDFLANNGGPTLTHALMGDSLAIDHGTGRTSATFFDCPRTDQRGFLRPVDGDFDGEAQCDIGAFEFGAVSPADVNADGTLDCLDVASVRASFGKRQGQAGFDPRADVNGDHLVDIKDLAFVAQQLPRDITCR
jgi:CSLREA domain-containing protein